MFPGTMMTVLALSAPVSVDDWTLAAMIVLFLAACLTVGPYIGDVLRTVASACSFGKSGGELKIRTWSPGRTFALTIVSCAAIAMALGFSRCPEPASGMTWPYVIKAFTTVILLFVLKQSVCRTVNSRLFNRQLTSVKPVRWNSFLSTMLAFSGILFLLVSFVCIFTGMSARAVRYCIVFIVVLMESGVVYNIKTALFSGRCSIFGFLLYLCTLEFGPLALAMVILRTNIH